jgi:UDP-N-acetylmuramoyl-tripeptide--D-alanyl-D-alanine ligase
MTIALWVLAAAAFGLAAVRWLRVAQREHYLSRTVTRFAWRWWNSRSANRALFLIGLVALGAAWVYQPFGLLATLVVIVGPLGLSITGRTAPLGWTVRLRRLVTTMGGLAALLVVAGGLADRAVETLVATGLLLPVLADAALAITAPIEQRLSDKYVDRATRTLSQVAPTVVAITGSYGKTTTKAYLERLLRESFATVASPASFNNRLGLARAVNEHLAPGTEVFIAEMGTYGKGEIAELCSWIVPTVGVLTAIGPVHLERFGSLEKTVEAKSEILAGARTAVINVDDPLLAELADRISVEVIRCSCRDSQADVFIDAEGGGVFVRGSQVATLDDPSIFPSNLACALGAALALAVPMDGVGRAVDDLPGAQHRQTISVSDLGFAIIDDTYNSNPAGARSALATLERVAAGHRRVLVTPGMVELGRSQYEENVALGALAAHTITDVVIVGRTNRAALLEGTAGGGASVIVVDSREQAVEWIRANLGDGDVVLYENDLPDHYP